MANIIDDVVENLAVTVAESIEKPIEKIIEISEDEPKKKNLSERKLKALKKARDAKAIKKKAKELTMKNTPKANDKSFLGSLSSSLFKTVLAMLIPVMISMGAEAIKGGAKKLMGVDEPDLEDFEMELNTERDFTENIQTFIEPEMIQQRPRIKIQGGGFLEI